MPRDPAGRLVRPPAPWTNVLANERFGCVVSETGAGFTWSGNSRAHRLTPWSNDPVLDPHDDALYVRDHETGRFWSPMPGPARGEGDYEARHGFGFTRFRHVGEGLEHDTTVHVDRHDSVRVTRLRIHNPGPRARRLSLFSYQRLVLGGVPDETARHVITEYRVEAGALLARNPWAGPDADRVAFAAVIAPDGIRGHQVSC